ncbi:hypothetical protein OIV83_004915 [Microbotryomycetes sp. JL201]|nr:hypothetical protein OIV83_004915 [Microbotryomycetes sp. JL201]
MSRQDEIVQASRATAQARFRTAAGGTHADIQGIHHLFRQSIDDALTSIRRELSTRLASTRLGASPPQASYHGRRTSSGLLRSALQQFLDTPDQSTSSSGNRQSGSAEAQNLPLSPHSSSSAAAAASTSHSTLVNVPFAPGSHQVLPIGPDPDLARAMRQDDAPPDSARAEDELPAYTRRAANAAARARLPPTRLHVHTSKSRKMELQMAARGEDHVILAQTEPGAEVSVQGSLVVSLPQPEAVNFIRIRLKGIVQTQVAKTGAGAGRQAMLDEALIWEQSVVLWNGNDFLSSNESPDASKLQGTFIFPFKLSMPGNIKYPLLTSNRPNDTNRKTRAPPPSFVLTGQSDEAYSRGTEWASCRYYVKVTLGRKGLLKVNERFVVPIIYVPRHAEPEMSAMRTVAAAQGLPTPGPDEDPSGWRGKQGLLSNKRAAWYETVLLLPTPAIFPRLSVIPFAIKITSSDPNVTGRFPTSNVRARLVQRALVCAQGLVNVHDKVVATGIVQEHGPAEGIPIQPDREGEPEPACWEKRFKGVIALGRGVGSSFKAPNLAVSFLVVVTVAINGIGNYLEVTMPLEIVSSAPVIHSRAPSRPESRGSNHSSTSLPFPVSTPPRPNTMTPHASAQGETTGVAEEQGQGLSFAAEWELPPSYFDVVEQDARRR